MARPTKYNEQVVSAIVQALSMGATYELAAQYAGISYDTFNTWAKTKSQFLEAVKKAEGEAVVKWLAKIEKAASDGNWQAAAWKLERRYPKDYGRQIIEHAGQVDLTVKGYTTKDASPDTWDTETE